MPEVIPVDSVLKPPLRRFIERAENVEFAGGIGDVILRCHQTDAYKRLDDLPMNKEVAILDFTHSPHAKEVALWHPCAPRMRIFDFGYTREWNRKEWRDSMNIPPIRVHRPMDYEVKYHTAPNDREALVEAATMPAFVVFAMTGSEDRRNVPVELIEKMVGICAHKGLMVALVGKTYGKRSEGKYHLRREPEIKHDNLVSFVDRLSVPGVGALVQMSQAAVVAHSVVFHIAWYAKKRTYLVYDAHTSRLHKEAGDTGFFLGATAPGNVVTTFRTWKGTEFEGFIDSIKKDAERRMP